MAQQSTTNLSSYQTLRNILVPSFKGPNWDSVLNAIATGNAFIQNLAVNVVQNFYIKTASGYWLDVLLNSNNFSRPDLIGISDSSYKQLWIKAYNHPNTVQGILNALAVGYLPIYTNASLISTQPETYNFSSTQTLMFNVDGNPCTIVIPPSAFQTASKAQAQEVAMYISEQCATNGYNAYADVYLNPLTNLNEVILYTNTLGTQGSVQVVGGSAQNILQFPNVVTNTQTTNTQYTITVNGTTVHWAWTSGTKPPLNSIQSGYYVNIYGTEFNSANQGTFTLTNVANSNLTDGSGFFEYQSPVSFGQTVTLQSVTSVLFFNPIKNRVFDQNTFASVVETIPGETDVYMPAATTLLFSNPNTGSSFITDTLYYLQYSNTSFTSGETILGLTSFACGYSTSTSNNSMTVSMISNTKFVAGELIYGYTTQYQTTLSTSTPYTHQSVIGPFLFDPTKPEIVNFNVTLNQVIYPNEALTSLLVSSVTNVSNSGYFYVGTGLNSYEGPISYNGISGNYLLVNSSYSFINYHNSGEYVDLTIQKTPTSILTYNTPYFGAILSDVYTARQFLQSVITTIYPAGFNLNLTVLYPSIFGISLNDIKYIYGDNP